MASESALPDRHPWYWLVPGAPDQWTGGHLYNTRIIAQLRAVQQPITIVSLPGLFPDVDALTLSQARQRVAALPDAAVVIIDSLAYGPLPELWAAERRRLRLIALCHLPLAAESGLPSLLAEQFDARERWSLESAMGVIVTSQHCAGLLRHAGVPSARLAVVEPGVEPPVSRVVDAVDQRSLEAPLQLLCVANVTPRKGHDVLIDALGLLRDQGWRCALVGSLESNPPFVAELRERASALGIASRLDWVGAVPPEEMNRWYARSDLMVIASRFETYGMVVTEAVAAGLPVLCSDAGALPDTLPAGSGLLFEATSAHALADRLGGLLADRARLADLRDGACRAAQSLPDWAHAAREMQQAVTALAAETVSRERRDHFTLDWLRLREPLDHAARAMSLTLDLASWAQQTRASSAPQSALEIVDLGSGAGSNLRYLAPRLPVAQRWLLVDHDPQLLAAAVAPSAAVVGADEAPVSVATRQCDLRSLPDLGAACAPQLITASALIDLVSEDWLRALVNWVVARRAALLVVLSVDGWAMLPDQHPDDAAVRTAFNAHQRGHGPFGRGLGPDAVSVLQQLLSGHDYTVRTATSAWRVDARHAELQRALIQGWERAASEQEPEQRLRFQAWRDWHLQNVGRSDHAMGVGHLDLLALPGQQSAKGG